MLLLLTSVFGLLILYKLWAGERFQFEKAVPRCMREALIFGDLVGFLVLCCVRYAFCLVVWARFLPCSIGANHGWLRHIGWVQSGHGLTSRPRETSDVRILDELLFSLWLPSWVGMCFAAWYFAFEILYVSVCS